MTRFDPTTFDFSTMSSIVTNHEKKLYDILFQQLEEYYPNQYILFPKVKVTDIVKMNKSDYSTRGRVKSRHVDFLICDKRTLKPKLVVELQDGTHHLAKGKYKDALLSSVFESAGLEMLQLWTLDQRSINTFLSHILPQKQQLLF